MRSNHLFPMNRVKWLLLLFCFSCLSTSKHGRGPLAMVDAGPGDLQARLANPTRLAGNYGRLPLSFEVNRGQTDARVKFLARGPGYTLFLTGDEAVLALRKPEGRTTKFEIRNSKFEIGKSKLEIRNSELEAATGIPRPLIPNLEPSMRGSQPRAPNPESRPSTFLRMKLLGANPAAKVSGAEELRGRSNYFIGNDPSNWRINVPTYAKVKYEGIYPGVDLVFYGNRQWLENDFVVAPGADPSAIALVVGTGIAPPTRARQAVPLRVDAKGGLVVQVEGGEVQFQKPLIYQEGSGGRREVPGGYVLKGTREVAFKVAAYDHTKRLVIDPVLAYSTYLGGDFDAGDAIAVDSSGNAYVTGLTQSTNFPITGGAFQKSLKAAAGNNNGFITKLDSTGSELVYSTYLGGNGSDFPNDIVVSPSGAAYVAGFTASSDFPTTPGAFQTTFGSGSYHAFVTELNPSGSALVYSTYLGGGSYAAAVGIAVDSSGNAYVTGQTESNSFPTTVGAFQTLLAGTQNSFVSKLNPSGSALVYSTYLGGNAGDYAGGIVVDPSGNAYVTGETSSNNFPMTAGAFQTELAGTDNVFISKLNPSGSALVYSTYLGGSSYDGGVAIAVDSSGSAYVTGWTYSSNFPTTAGAFQTSLAGGMDAFVTKLNPTGSALIYSTYLGGSSSSNILGSVTESLGIGVDASADAYVAGFTTTSNFPTTPGAFQTTFGGPTSGSYAYDAFFTELNPSGASLLYSTYLGGNGLDLGQADAVDSLGNVYVTGQTESSNFPTTPGAFQTSLAGLDNAFVAKFENALSAQVTNLRNTVKTLVTAGTLSPALSQLLLAPLNAALAALGDPSSDSAAQAASGSGHETAARVALVSRQHGAAIRDLYEFIDRVQFLVILGQLKRVEGRILTDAAKSLITALGG